MSHEDDHSDPVQTLPCEPRKPNQGQQQQQPVAYDRVRPIREGMVEEWLCRARKPS